MKVIVVGGYGVFGERLVRLLCRDGHAVWVAGRDADKAARLAQQVYAVPLCFDREGSFDVVAQIQPDVLIDAAGPFHHYGESPYRLVQACLEANINYMDLADDAQFCSAIGVLDAVAKARGCYALSGVSSVPAISAAAVRALSEGFEHIEQIDSAILPGNRAPRGRSVVSSILSQCGRSRSIWQGGRWIAMRGWSAPRRFRLGDGIARSAWLIGVPDLDLFPQRFGARSVSFRAGLELPIMNHALAFFSWLRSRYPFAIFPALLHVARATALLLWPFGSDRGGMVVEVTGRDADQSSMDMRRRRWTLVADAGDGPYVPAIAARALLRGAAPAAGARPCLDELTLAAAESAMSDLSIRFEREEQTLRPLFESVPGLNWNALPTTVRASHQVFGTHVFAGRAKVERGSGMGARLIATIFGFPAAASSIEVEVVKTREGEVEHWQRRFGSRSFHSQLAPLAAGITERFGPFVFELGLHELDAALNFPVRRGWLLGIPLPRWLLPRSEAREYERDGRFHFDVALHAPCGVGLVVRYNGWLEPVA